MPDEAAFAELMGRLRGGDEGAAAEVFDRFTGRLVALARRQLRDGLRRKEDPEDVVQSVYKSFFRRQHAGQFRLGDRDDLWAVLTVITLRKCSNRAEYFHAARRDVRREAPAGAPEWRAAYEAIARDPTPSEAAALAETVERLMLGLDEDDRRILTLHLQGYTAAEVGEQVGFAERTVHRALDRIRKRLRRLESEG